MRRPAGQSPPRGISAIEIDFPLGIAAPGGLTSGFALPI